MVVWQVSCGVSAKQLLWESLVENELEDQGPDETFEVEHSLPQSKYSEQSLLRSPSVALMLH